MTQQLLPPPVGQGLLIIDASRSHSDTLTLGKTPLEERSATGKYLYPTTHKTQKETDIFGPLRDSNPQSQQANGRRLHALGRTATGIGWGAELHMCGHVNWNPHTITPEYDWPQHDCPHPSPRPPVLSPAVFFRHLLVTALPLIGGKVRRAAQMSF